MDFPKRIWEDLTLFFSAQEGGQATIEREVAAVRLQDCVSLKASGSFLFLTGFRVTFSDYPTFLEHTD